MRYYYFLFCFFSITFLCAQEVVSNLVSNPFLLGTKFISSKEKNVISLPFFDDFSYNSTIVDSNKWQRSSVFLNRNYPINPPTLGVVTFDGLNEFGLARDFNQFNVTDPSDTLLSKSIDLSTVNSVYFMFYYQAKGMGDAPEIQDKFVLEFLNDTLGWEQVWSADYNISEDFYKVVKVINELRFLHDSFQFRFRNYATVSGNFDHWHLDYN